MKSLNMDQDELQHKIKSIKPTLLYVVNVDWFFISHRLPIAIKAIDQGYRVHVACHVSEHHDYLSKQGIIVHPLKTNRKNNNPFSLVKLFLDICKIYKALKPDLVHLVTIKPVLIGGIAAKLLKIPSVVIAISGLGFVFISKGFFAKIRQILINFIYRFALNQSNLTVIFQNEDDKNIIKEITNLDEDDIALIPGSGVDLDDFHDYQAYPIDSENRIVLMASRILKDKGVIEFANAAKLLKKKDPSIRFILVGMIDEANPAALSIEELGILQNHSGLEYLGNLKSIKDLLYTSSVVVLPSYREGLPKVLLEAAAAARPIVTTDVPGCRDAILNNVTGLLVPLKNSVKLAEAIQLILSQPKLAKQMGINGRRLAEEKFSSDFTIRDHIQLYENLLSNAK